MKFLTNNTRNIFLIDGSGALLTAALLLGVVNTFENLFRIPANTLYVLASIALLLSACSFCFYSLAAEKWKQLLKIIIACNILYCCITLAMIYTLSGTITTLGIVYFLIEIGVILTLVIVELQTLRR